MERQDATLAPDEFRDRHREAQASTIGARTRRLWQSAKTLFLNRIVPKAGQLSVRGSGGAHAETAITSQDLQHLDRFLRFSAPVEARYEADTGAERVAHLRMSILIGLVVYNVYNITDMLLMPDIMAFGLAFRILIVSPLSVGLVWAVGRVSPHMREFLMFVGMVDAIAIPMVLFYYSTSPTAILTFIEIPLTMVFGSTMLLLRFPWAVAFTATSFVMVALGIAFSAGIGGSLAAVLLIQMGTGCFFTLYGNYKLESARRGAYLVSLREILRSDRLEIDRDVLTALSTTDALTGLSNRRKLDERLATWTADAARDGTGIAVLMIDVDHFKRFNDAYGHPEGDACLRKIADVLTQEAGDGFVARYGGEEFSILLRDVADEAQVKRLTQAICNRVAVLGLPHTAREDGLVVVTVSIGAAVLEAGAAAASETIFAAADAALYEAKRAGRNRAVTRSFQRPVPATAPSFLAA